jgi:hypothetical protein
MTCGFLGTLLCGKTRIMAAKSAQASPGDYRILGLKPGASPDDARAAYKSLVKIWHPDRFPENSSEQQRAEEKLKSINTSYQRIRSDWGGPPYGDHQREAGTAASPPHDSPDSTSTGKTGKGNQHPGTLGGLIFRGGAYSLAYLRRIRAGHKPWLRGSILAVASILLAMLWISTVPLSHWKNVIFNDSPPDPVAQTTPSGQDSAVRAPAGREGLGQDKLKQLHRSAAVQVPPAKEGARRVPESLAGEKAFFTLGSLKQDVLRVQGKPHRVYGQTWVYGLSDVTFKEGRVWRYNNFDGSLNLRVLPAAHALSGHRPIFFSLGASQDEVLQVQGTPTRVDSTKWYYGFSEVNFKEGRGVGFNNFFNNLMISMDPTKETAGTPAKGFFTIGSSQDEVLAIQGTPTAIQANVWSYQLSDVWFQDGKVRMVNNFSGNLKFTPPDLASEK